MGKEGEGEPRSREGGKEPFERSLKSLEEIVQRLESGELDLEESLQLFEEGVRLIRVCTGGLEEAEKRIEVLMRSAEGGIVTQPGEPELFEQKTDDAEGEGETG
ncbi:MAG: exodeoxyribonuclease VII small subunit [bacterium]